jgi:hypothetical protein
MNKAATHQNSAGVPKINPIAVNEAASSLYRKVIEKRLIAVLWLFAAIFALNALGYFLVK